MINFFGRSEAMRLLPSRGPEHHKALSGRAAIFAGHIGMFGAAILSATAAARIGAGYVELITDLKNFPGVENPDFLLLDQRTTIGRNLRAESVAVGPGLHDIFLIRKIIRELQRQNVKKVVLDAGALSAIANQKMDLEPSWILTPHEGELGRLLKVPASEIQANRIAAATEAHQKYNCIVLLKGNGTLIASKNFLVKIKSGNPSLAKAGTGDVLTGMIAGLLAQGLNPEDAAPLAAYIHGKMSDDWIAAKKDVLSLMASDLLKMLPKTLATLRKNVSNKPFVS